MRTILRLLANAAALAVATWLLTGITLNTPTTSRKIVALLVVALIFGVLNALVKPVFKLVTAPIVLLTSWVADKIDLGWHVDGFWTAVFGAIIVSIVSFLLSAFVPDRDDRRRRG